MGHGGVWMDIMFTIVPIFIGIIFVIIVVSILFGLLKELTKWRYNNRQPVLSVAARVVAKRTRVSRHEHTSSYYYCTFEVRDGTRHEFWVEGEEYGQLVEGDTGTLTYQGTRYRGFDRQLSHWISPVCTSAIYVAPVQKIFATAPLYPLQWLMLLLCPPLILIADELRKRTAHRMKVSSLSANSYKSSMRWKTLLMSKWNLP